jgi:hypothetical protein
MLRLFQNKTGVVCQVILPWQCRTACESNATVGMCRSSNVACFPGLSCEIIFIRVFTYIDY